MAFAQESPKSLLDQLSELAPFLPSWLTKALLLVLVLGLVMAGLMHWLPLMRFIGRSTKRLFVRTDRRRALRRALFADHVESQMRRLGEKEEWRDSRYAELEAELEISGGKRGFFRKRSPRALRRVPSLSAALEDSDERIVLLEGEPGAGKSVAIRHLAQRMATGVMRRPSEDGVIPVYVNLKTFMPTSSPPSADDVREFVLKAVNQVRDRDIERFLQDEFQAGIDAGTWLFLFDSFDEIPAILSATEADEVITGYADALHGFLHGMNRCRGIVASREFRGPGRSEWPRFRVVPLSQKRKVDLIEKAELPVDAERMLLADLPNADIGVQQMSDNPLFLGLLCEHMREGNAFPTNVHSVLETYVEHRLRRDASLVAGYYDVTENDVREIAEELAFTIAEQESFGLDVDKAEAVSLLSANLQRSSDEVGRVIEALIYTKLARNGDTESSVTFSHRRLQEYFATCIAIRDSSRVDVRSLLTDGRWRETAVTIVQTQEPEQYEELLSAARTMLPDQSDDLWAPGVLYVLGVLTAGGGRPGSGIAERAGEILRNAWREGQRYDRKWVLEVIAAADRDTVVTLLQEAFASRSEWLRQEAYNQVRMVPDVAGEVAPGIRQTLLDLSVGGRLRRDRRSVLSQLSRLPESAQFTRYLRSLLFAPILHVGTIALWIALAVTSDMQTSAADVVSVSGVVLASFFLLRLALASNSVRSNRIRSLRWFLMGDEFAAAFMLQLTGWAFYLALPLASAIVVAKSFSVLSVLLAVATVVNMALVSILLLGAHLAPEDAAERFSKHLAFLRANLKGKLRFFIAALLAVCAVCSWPLFYRDAFLQVAYQILAVLGVLMVVVLLCGNLPSWHESRKVTRYLRGVEWESLTPAQVERFLAEVRGENAVLRLLAALGRSENPLAGDLGDFFETLARAMMKKDRLLDPPGLERVAAGRSGKRTWINSTVVLDEINILLERSRRKVELGALRS